MISPCSGLVVVPCSFGGEFLCFSALEHFNTTLNMSRKGKEKGGGEDASGLWQLVAEMQAIANFTNKWPIGKSQMCVTM